MEIMQTQMGNKRGKMSKTLRWFMLERGLSYNPFWSTHEDKIVRTNLHRASRHENKLNISKDRDIEIETKTCGWITW